MKHLIYLLFLLVLIQRVPAITGILHSLIKSWNSELCNQLGFYKNDEEVLGACNGKIKDLLKKLEKQYADLEEKKQEILMEVQKEAEERRKEQEKNDDKERNKRLQIQLKLESEEANKRKEAQLRKEEAEIDQRYIEQIKREQDEAHARKLQQFELEYAQQNWLNQIK